MWQSCVDWLVHDTIGLSRSSALGSALDFFIYDTAKIFFLLVVIIFAISLLRSFFPPEKTKRLLEKVPVFIGNILAALLYIASGIVVAIASGNIIGRMKLEKWVEEYVYKIHSGETAALTLTWKNRIGYAFGYVGEIVGKVWPYVLVGIAIGGFMHGHAPADFLVKYAGPSTWYPLILTFQPLVCAFRHFRMA